MNTTVTAMDAMLALQHIRAMHPERAEVLSNVCDFIRKQDAHNTSLRSELLKVQGKLDEYKVLYHGSFCQRLKRFFVRAKVNPNVG